MSTGDPDLYKAFLCGSGHYLKIMEELALFFLIGLSAKVLLIWKKLFEAVG